eukprot:TRINITY_DN1117_c0_g1_i2.p1 TRINITY_DN1117_c0_g1~~TRINITY_DN1117_c0_g1_i2.p1  ORF type:complete len:160 (-),score=36.62 TRINITY_DN1117_c0_g1_i2:22-501(-)
MSFLHSKHITHRDIKAQNCLVVRVGDDWKIRICDFGFARMMTSAGPSLMTLCGTDDFMSPELMLGEDYDERADIFSYGLLLSELILRKKSAEALPRSYQTCFGLDEKMYWSAIPSDCPPAFSKLTWACCEYYPKDRPSFKEIIQQLKTILSSLKLDAKS